MEQENCSSVDILYIDTDPEKSGVEDYGSEGTVPDAGLRSTQSMPDLLPEKFQEEPQKERKTTRPKSLRTKARVFPISAKPHVAFGRRVPPKIVSENLQRQHKSALLRSRFPDHNVLPSARRVWSADEANKGDGHPPASRVSSAFTLHTDSDIWSKDDLLFTR